MNLTQKILSALFVLVILSACQETDKPVNNSKTLSSKKQLVDSTNVDTLETEEESLELDSIEFRPEDIIHKTFSTGFMDASGTDLTFINTQEVKIHSWKKGIPVKHFQSKGSIKIEDGYIVVKGDFSERSKN